MSDFAGFDLDRSTARAWSKFQVRLADHVAEMDDDDVLLVRAESSADEDDGSSPYVRFCGIGENRLRCEVSGHTSPAGDHLLDQVGVETLNGLGWSTRGGDDVDPGEPSANLFLEVDRSHADRLAVMAVKAFRDVFGVAHPVFLSSDHLAQDESAPDLGVPMSDLSSGFDPEEPIAVVPRDREHLQSLIDDALTPFFGHVPEHDEDDDIPVVCGSSLVFVRVLEETPVIKMFASLVCDVTDLERAAFEVTVLNRDTRFIKFVVVEDRVMAYVFLPAWPFAPQHLRGTLALMAETIDEIDDDLLARVGGRRAFDIVTDDESDEDEEEDDEEADVDEVPMHPAMMTLLQLDAEAPGSTDPELAASICGMDRDLTLELIAWNSQQEISWRRARDRAILIGDPDGEADVCEQEMRSAERMTNLLRRALRLLVERELGRERGESSYDAQPRRRARKKLPPKPPRNSVDPSLVDTDPDLWE